MGQPPIIRPPSPRPTRHPPPPAHNINVYDPTPPKKTHTQRQFLFALPNSLEMEQEVKLRVTVLRRLRSLKRAVPFQYIGMFAGACPPLASSLPFCLPRALGERPSFYMLIP